MPEELASLLKPYFQIKKPEGEESFPTILGFHGAGGMRNEASGIRKTLDDWTDYLVGLGYATIIIDSYTASPSRRIPAISGNPLIARIP